MSSEPDWGAGRCGAITDLDMRIVTLKRRAEFLRVRGGARWATRAFTLETKPRIDFGTHQADAVQGPRFGFTVTKKVGNAVIRNRIRRRLKEALRSLQSDAALGGNDYILIARVDVASCRFDQLKADLALALERVNANAPGARGRTTAGNGVAGAKKPQPQADKRDGRDQRGARARRKT